MNQTEREQRRMNVDIHKIWPLKTAIHDVGRVSVLGTARERLCCMRVSILLRVPSLFRLTQHMYDDYNHDESPSRLTFEPFPLST